MSAISSWLASGLWWGSVWYVAAWVMSKTVLRHAHPSTHALLFALVLFKFVVPFAVTVPGAPSMLTVFDPIVVVAQAQPLAVAEGALLLQWLFAAWLSGVIVIATVRIARHLRLLQALRGWPTAPLQVTREVQRVAELLAAPLPPVVESDVGPCLVGVINPTLVLPSGVAGDELRAMAAHELMHLRRRDGVVRLGQLIVETLFFFWPLARLAGRQLSLAREQACDLAVVEAQVMSRAAYAELLLHVGQAQGLGLAMASKSSHLEKRIVMVLNEKKVRSMRGVVLLTGVIGVGVLGSAATSSVSALPEAAVQLDVAQTADQPDRLVSMTVHTHLHEIRRCFDVALAEKPSLSGSFSVHWRIETDGHVSETCMQDPSGPGLEALGRCVSEKIEAIEFPRPSGMQSLEVVYPFSFRSDGNEATHE